MLLPRLHLASWCRHSRCLIRKLRLSDHLLFKLAAPVLSVRPLHTSHIRWQSSRSPDDNKEEKNNDKPKFQWSAFVRATALTVGVAALFSYLSANSDSEDLRLVPWNVFVHEMLAKGEVEELIVAADSDIVTIRLHSGAVFRGQPSLSNTYHMRVANVRNFEEQLRQVESSLGISTESGVSIIYQRSSSWPFFVLLAFFGYLLFRTFASGKKGTVRFNVPDIYGNLRKAKYRLVSPFAHSSTPRVKFSDVLGLTEAKMEVKEFVDYLKRPEQFTKLGAKLPRGALLLGPPGCGKTLLAKAVAGEASVPVLAVNGTEFIEIVGGLGAARVRDLFKEAKDRQPCIVYIDEIDAIGKKRSGIGDSTQFQSGEEEQTLNQLLVEMDGIVTNSGVIVLASTNRPDVLDKALLRRGRFDRHILIDLPTNVEREAMFKYYLKKIKTTEEIACYSYLADRTPGYSGADIMNVCNEAAIRAATLGKGSVDLSDVEYALERTLSGSQRKTNSITPFERERIAYHESGHALVGWMLKHTDALVKISIVPRTKNVTGMGFTQHSKTEKHLMSKEELMDRMAMALGGWAAEACIYGSTSTGAEDDLKKVTKIAYAMVQRYGMSDVFGPLSFPDDGRPGSDFTPKPYSKLLKNVIDKEASSVVRSSYAVAERIVREKTAELELLTRALIDNETLTYAEIQDLIGPPCHGPKQLTQKELQFPEDIDNKSA